MAAAEVSDARSEGVGRTALWLHELGLLVVMVMALPYKTFELDRYFVPKELVLHAVAFCALVALALRVDALRRDVVDVALACFVAWSFVTVLGATNPWLAQRAFAITLSSALLFWLARSAVRAGQGHALLIAAGAATVLAAATGLAQVYGVRSDLFSINRAPGGTFGNRNFVAHICAMGLPVLLYCVFTARRFATEMAWTIGMAAVAGMLFLSRTRAAWLAVAATMAILVLTLLIMRGRGQSFEIGGRIGRLGIASVIGVLLAVALPNRLNWRSDSPYLDSAKGLVDYSSGSGRGRLKQYTNSVRMTMAHPVLGVGPGNWPVEYVRFAKDGDPSLAADGMTANPWPSSDLVAVLSERGPVGFVLFLAPFALLFIGAFLNVRLLSDADAVHRRLCLVGTVTATMAVSAFDAVLLLPAPAMLAWTVLGASSGESLYSSKAIVLPARRFVLAVVFLLMLAGLARSAGSTVAIATVGDTGSRLAWVSAATLDPGSYRINLRAAQLSAASGRCKTGKALGQQARYLFPRASAPRQVLSRCR